MSEVTITMSLEMAKLNGANAELIKALSNLIEVAGNEPNRSTALNEEIIAASEIIKRHL